MAHDYTSERYRATLSEDGLLTVWRREDPVVVETTYRNGKPSVKAAGPHDKGSLGDLARAMANMPVFAATAAEDDPGWYHCDIDCGMQRWAGMRPEHELREALANCNFEEHEIEAMVAACEAAPWSHCPRQG